MEMHPADMQSPVLFRPAGEGDYPAIISMVRSREELFRVYPRGTYPLTVEQLSALAEVRIELTVALLDGEVAGFANLYNLTPGESAFIGNVIVDRTLRGKGIGRALINHMLGLTFGKYQLPETRISVFSDNIPALLLYSSVGFRPASIEERRDPAGGRAALLHMTISRKEMRS